MESSKGVIVKGTNSGGGHAVPIYFDQNKGACRLTLAKIALAADETIEMSDCALQVQSAGYMTCREQDGSFGAVSTSSLSTDLGLHLAEIVWP